MHLVSLFSPLQRLKENFGESSPLSDLLRLHTPCTREPNLCGGERNSIVVSTTEETFHCMKSFYLNDYILGFLSMNQNEQS